MTRQFILKLLVEERQRQEKKWSKLHDWGWGDCSSDSVAPITKSAILTEECGEVARAVLEQNKAQLKTELIQVAALAVAWLESLD